MSRLALVTLVVRDYDEAIAYYTRALGFQLTADQQLEPGKRWVVIQPPGPDHGAGLLLAKAATPEQESAIGNQTGGRVFLFLHTDDFWRDYPRMQGQGVEFCEQPRQESYGTVVVLQDLYGNRIDLIQHAAPEVGV
jgi:lactoylglutathione lyase